MNLLKYKKNLKHPLKPRTVSFLIDDHNVLLGLKKKGFGKGNLLGIGGKVEEGETIKEAAKRELLEEIAISTNQLEEGGVLNFYFPHIGDESWNMKVHIFVVRLWQEEPSESEEIKPQWFKKQKIPYEAMWDDAQYWLPEVLKGNKIDAEFMFDKDLKVIDHQLR